MKNKKLALAVILSAVLTASVFAATFHFIFQQTPYYPSQYNWTAPWEVKQKTDYVEAWLNITGSGYEGDLHSVELIIKNVAPVPNYAIIGLTYNATWNVGAESEVIIDGLYSGGLVAGENMTITGVFSPTLVGAGTINMDITEMQWAETESITWTLDTYEEASNKVQISNFAVYGCSKTYVETGTVNFTLTWIDAMASYGYASYKLEIVELGQVVAEETDIYLSKQIPVDFSVPFGPLTQGGLLTMKLSVHNIHN